MIFETSWDDGHILDLKLVDLLQKYGLSGTFYITCDNVGTIGYLSWEDVKEIFAKGFSVGSHTMSHPADLKALYDDDLRYEIGQSKATIESVLNNTVKSFCYPRGRYDERVLQYVAEAGYVEGRTTEVLRVTLNDDNLVKPTTIHVYDRSEYKGKDWLGIAKVLYKNVHDIGGYFHIWGHSHEIEKYNNWGKLEEFFKYVKDFSP